MALTDAEQNVLEQIADELDTVATWHTGARATKVESLANQVRNLSEVALQAEAEPKLPNADAQPVADAAAGQTAADEVNHGF